MDGPTALPTLQPHLKDVVQVVCRASKTLALTADGSVWSWGKCDNMSLGHGDKVTSEAVPRRIEALKGIRIVAIDAGETSGAAVSDEGEVFTWGWGGSFFGGNGGLGHGNNVSQPAPALVEKLVDSGVKIKQVAVGNAHMLALSTDGRVFSWGNGEYGRCGNGKSNQPLPMPVELLADAKVPVTQVAAGPLHSLAVTSDGQLWGWGKNDASQLGLGAGLVADLNTMEEYPVAVTAEGDEAWRFNGKVAAIATGSNHSAAIAKDGSVWQWGGRTFLTPSYMPSASNVKGSGAAGEGGEGAEAAAAAGSKKEEIVPLKAAQVVCGDSVTGVVDPAGKLYTWGRMKHSSALGHNASFLNIRNPSRVEALAGATVSCVSLGAHHGAAVIGPAPKLQ